jgi:predicted dehydrogenase
MTLIPSDTSAAASPSRVPNASRRDFLAASALASTAALASQLGLSSVAHAGGAEGVLKVGLIGCGGRGTGAASQALQADSRVELTALGDAFKDAAETSLMSLKGIKEITDKVKVTPEHIFAGFDAYKRVIDSGVDVVVLATPPHFRAEHLEYAVSKGKHAFVEKPVATCVAGYRRALQAAQDARAKGLAVVSGLCYRYEPEKRETMKRVHDGAIGEIVAMDTYYYTVGLWHRGQDPAWSTMQTQLRNWLYYTWLSGDHIVEQHIHSYDKCVWALQNKYPVRAWATGGRAARTDAKYGNVYDHFHVAFEFEGGLILNSTCRQMSGTSARVEDIVTGTKGRANLQTHSITGENAWRWRRKAGEPKPENMYQVEHNELFASIRAGKPLWNGDYMCDSSLMGILGREAAYTGSVITWQQLLDSNLNLYPAAYDMAANELPNSKPVAVPGVYKLG